VSAVIYGLTALGFVWLIGSFSRQSLEKHWWISLMIPGFFVFGLISDRVSSLSLSVLPNAIGQNIVIAQQNVMDGNAVTVYGPYAVSVIALVIAVIALVMSIKIKKKYWWTKIR
jgi:hypothetical protein